MSYLLGDYFALVDQGKVRRTNEDSASANINAYGNVLLIVCDGMGGAARGEYASKTATNHIVKEFLNFEKEFTKPKQISAWVNKVINEANTKVFSKAEKDPSYKGMGTTLSLVILVKDMMVTAQIGDSRIYALKDNELIQMSVDQTYANYLVQESKIGPSEASVHKNRHMLTNALGTKKNVPIDIQEYEYHGEKLLLCSDGLYNNVSHNIIESIVKGNDSIDRKCYQLISFGNANGGSDNMAVVIWESK